MARDQSSVRFLIKLDSTKRATEPFWRLVHIACPGAQNRISAPSGIYLVSASSYDILPCDLSFTATMKSPCIRPLDRSTTCHQQRKEGLALNCLDIRKR